VRDNQEVFSPASPNAPVSAGKLGRVLSTRTIAICAVLLVLVAGGGAWLLLANYGDGTAPNNARLDGIRTVGTIVLGAGGAIALLLAARRQQTAEQDLVEKRRDLALKELDQQHAQRVQRHVEKVAADTLDHQQRVAKATEDDAVARRITELYTTAVEQLGSGKAPVRLGGLYALERLAQDNESQRQTIVNVLCAYLRMPYFLAPHSGPPATDTSPSADAGVEEVPPMMPSRDEIRERTEERQVRLTAQRILTDHVKPGNDPNDPVPTFWHGIDLDLTGAALIDLDLTDGHIGSARFDGATFTGRAAFDRATFTGEARFGGATFTGTAGFNGVTVHGDTWFGGTTFTDDAWFIGATFTGTTEFNGATFTRSVRFSNATFTLNAAFSEVTFTGDARFSGTTFTGIAWFSEATFSGDAWFNQATFTCNTWTDGVTFGGNVRFSEATFIDAGFDGADFHRGRPVDRGVGAHDCPNTSPQAHDE
jgi:uncharacterized protein YjbI with pentapeptide repeats/cell division septation protein DedD